MLQVPGGEAVGTAHAHVAHLLDARLVRHATGGVLDAAVVDCTETWTSG